MLENEIFTLLRGQLIQRVAARYATPLGYRLRYQPTQEGRPSEPTVFMHTVTTRRYGWRESREVWDSVAGVMRLYERQPMESTIQFTAQRQPITDATAYTPTDVLNIIAATLQSDALIAALVPYSAGVLRVGDLRLQRYKNDRDQWEDVPSFDITFTHQQEYVDAVPVVQSFVLRFLAVPDNL